MKQYPNCNQYNDGDECMCCSENQYDEEKKKKAVWSFSGKSELPWPVDEDGEPEEAALLTTVFGTQVDYDMQTGMLNAFGIPTTCDFPGAGRLAKVILGFTGTGMEVYVPKSMLDAAQDLITQKPDEEENEDA